MTKKKWLYSFHIFLLLLSGLFVQAGNSLNREKDNTAVVAADALVHRLMPSFESEIEFIAAPSEQDGFQLSSQAGKIVIRANNANSMAVGLHYYLKYYCHSAVTWYRADSIYLPAKLPAVQGIISRKARVPNRFFLNYCTFGYTMPWWTWKDWQWFIDWMALNGINMPLAITGEEAVWKQVWKNLGLTDTQIDSFFTGPAYLPWNRMANIDGWEGPLPDSWLQDQLELQKKIVSRERELGMRPVLPAFAGHVPRALVQHYPQAKITSLGAWDGFDEVYHSYFLDAFDPLFSRIQKEYLSEQTRLFGSDHIYGIDPFNEVTPPSWEPAYLASASQQIFKSLKAADPKAKWLQMTWMFYYQRKQWTDPRIKAYLTAVPKNKMILLDYFCDKTEVWKMTDQFYGQPYIWCYLGNFGGNTMLAGNLKEVERRMENTFSNGGDQLWGVGSTLEGFDCNPVMYEYVFEKAWSDGPVDVDQWMKGWAGERLGYASSESASAWRLMADSIYIKHADVGQATLTNCRPSLTGNGNWTTQPAYAYNNRNLLDVWQKLLKVQGPVPAAYRFDVANIGRQVLGNYFGDLRKQFREDYEHKDLKALQTCGRQMKELLQDMNSLLGTHHAFLLGRWLEAARKMGVNQIEKDYYEQDARRLITTWGNAGHDLNDYANRSWSGLIDGFYAVRWKMFIDEVIRAVATNKSFDEQAFDKKVNQFEWNWTSGHEIYPSRSTKNTLFVARRLYHKYEMAIRRSY